MLQFFQSLNLKCATMESGAPWDFNPPDLAQWRELSKDKRRAKMILEKTRWNVYSAVGGLAPNLRVDKDNPPTVLRGIVVDYDMEQDVPSILNLLNQIKPDHVPNFIEITLSGNARLVWVFEKEILTPNAHFCADVIKGFIQKLGADTLLPGFDHNSYKPAEVWTNGGEWHTVNEKPMPWKTVFGILCSLTKSMKFGEADIPLSIIADEAEKRFPGRWQGPFELNNLGVRFWDDLADNQTGCQVKPDGMLCFTGRTPFMTWDKIFGASWCNELRATNLGHAAAETYFDGRNYWGQCAGLWVPKAREDVMLQLKNRGISAKTEKGQTASPAERVLHYIQNTNRVTGAAPLINYKPGLVTLDGDRVLNVCTIRPLKPADKSDVTPEDFPWTWKFLNGLFDHPELHPLDYFLAWLKRAYFASLNYRAEMGQALFVCGKADSGKTLLCYRYLKPMFGNKLGQPYDYFTGVTQHNDELFKTHLLAINDEEATTRDEARQKFIARLKSFVVNPSHTYHPKFCARLNVDWTGRIFVTLNDDPASVGLLPEVNENTKDKLMYFASLPYAGVWEDKWIIEKRIATELPFFCRWLLEWEPPKELILPGRMGVKSFFDPRILEFSQQQGPAYVLLELIKIWCEQSPFWSKEKTEWIGTASELITQFSVLDELHVLLKDWNSHRAAKALTTLARSGVSGISLINQRGHRLYKITKADIGKETK